MEFLEKVALQHHVGLHRARMLHGALDTLLAHDEADMLGAEAGGRNGRAHLAWRARELQRAEQRGERSRTVQLGDPDEGDVLARQRLCHGMCSRNAGD